MRSFLSWRSAFATAILAVALPGVVCAQDATRGHLDTLLTATGDTPGGQGLVPMALAEAWVALEQARLAGRAAGDLDALQRHARGVIHAVDPTLVTRGPGAGYGVRRAMAEIGRELALAAGTGAADVQRVAPATSMVTANVTAWADALVVTAERIASATSVSAAEAEVADLVRLARQLTFGVRADGAERRLATPPDAPGLLALRSRVQALVLHRAALAAAGVEAGR